MKYIFIHSDDSSDFELFDEIAYSARNRDNSAIPWQYFSQIARQNGIKITKYNKSLALDTRGVVLCLNSKKPNNCPIPAILLKTEPQCIINRKYKLATYSWVFSSFTSDQNRHFVEQFHYPCIFNDMIDPFKKREVDVTVVCSNLMSLTNYKNNYRIRRNLVFSMLGNKNMRVFGRNWDKIMPTLLPINSLLNKSINGLVHRLTPRRATSIKSVKSKIDAYKNTQFVLCIENSDEDGYTTEKIFDALSAGAIPIYAGSHIEKSVVPQQCYINLDDKRANVTDLIANLQSHEIESYKSEIRVWQLLSKTKVNYYKHMPEKILSKVLELI